MVRAVVPLKEHHIISLTCITLVTFLSPASLTVQAPKPVSETESVTVTEALNKTLTGKNRYSSSAIRTCRPRMLNTGRLLVTYQGQPRTDTMSVLKT
jgi:hypothetical protein